MTPKEKQSTLDEFQEKVNKVMRKQKAYRDYYPMIEKARKKDAIIYWIGAFFLIFGSVVGVLLKQIIEINTLSDSYLCENKEGVSLLVAILLMTLGLFLMSTLVWWTPFENKQKKFIEILTSLEE